MNVQCRIIKINDKKGLIKLTNKNEIKVLDENLVKEINVDRIELYFDYDEKKITVEQKVKILIDIGLI